jgi:hypothetical protein
MVTTLSSRPRIPIPAKKLAAFCLRWKVTELALFGSALRDDFRPESDVDLLVSFAPDARWSLFDLVGMQNELKQIFGREVDLVERTAIESSENYIRRRNILSATKVIYSAPVEEDPAYKLVGLGASKVRQVADKHDDHIVDEIEKETLTT